MSGIVWVRLCRKCFRTSRHRNGERTQERHIGLGRENSPFLGSDLSGQRTTP